MRLYLHHSGEVRAESKFEEKDILKGAGFQWHKYEKYWWTPDITIALPLIEYADEQLRAAIAAHQQRSAQAIVASRAVAAQVEVPAPEGLVYMPHQLAAIAYSGERVGALNADEMGLGKTISALGVINSDQSIKKVVVVCPAMLKINWAREAKKWLARPFRIIVVNGGKLSPDELTGQDSVLVIINYEVLGKHQTLLNSIAWDLVVLDEAHYCKNYKAARTKLATQLLARGRRRLALTGTPVLAAPQDLVEILMALDPKHWSDRFAYLRRYCGFMETTYGWACTDPANLSELQEKLRGTVMVRRLKSDVLTDLPPKMRQVIVLEQSSRELRAQVMLEKKTLRQHHVARAAAKSRAAEARRTGNEQAYRDAVNRLREIGRVALEDISRLRQETALLKLPYVIEYLQNNLEQTANKKVVVFAHHVAILKKLQQAFPDNSVLVYGDIPFQARQAAIDRFQADRACQVFIAGIRAASLGITLTAASHVVFAELDWTPACMKQAEDRLHRIGQLNPITIQQVVVDDSIDARIAKVLLRKQAIIDKCLDVDANVVTATDEEDTGLLDELLAEQSDNPDQADISRQGVDVAA